MCRFLYIEKGKKNLLSGLCFIFRRKTKQNETKSGKAKWSGKWFVFSSLFLLWAAFAQTTSTTTTMTTKIRKNKKKNWMKERKNGRTNERKRCSIHQKEEERKKIITVEPINARRKHRLQPVASLLHVWGFHLKFRFQVWNIPFLFGEGGVKGGERGKFPN